MEEKLKITDLEKYLLENTVDDNEFKIFLETSCYDNLLIDYSEKDRKLSDEEIDYEYYNDFIVEFFDSLLEAESEEHHHHHEHHHNGHGEEEHVCKCGTCHCHEKKEENNVSVKEIRLVYKLALYMLKEGIHYEDLAQEGIIGLLKAKELYKDDNFNLYRDYFIAKYMFEHINEHVNYRKYSFKQFVENEKEKNKTKKFKISLKDKTKDEELKVLERKEKEEYKENLEKIEEITSKIFDYHSLKYRLSFREIEAIILYFSLNGRGEKNFSEIASIMEISTDEVDKLLKDSIYKLSVTEEKVEI